MGLKKWWSIIIITKHKATSIVLEDIQQSEIILIENDSYTNQNLQRQDHIATNGMLIFTEITINFILRLINQMKIFFFLYSMK